MPEHRTDHGTLLDHAYDGIQEYDNPTPGWWHAIFIGSIFFSVIYATFFHFSEIAWSPHSQLAAAEAGYYEKLFGEVGELTPDEDTIASMRHDERWMAFAGSLYSQHCIGCHGQDAQGLTGPNLTDDHYLNITSITGIYDVLTEGVVANGMPAWDTRLGQNERVLLAAYVASLRERPVAPGRAPEGNIIDPWPAGVAIAK